MHRAPSSETKAQACVEERTELKDPRPLPHTPPSPPSFFFKIFLMGTIFKVFIESATVLFLFYIFGSLASRHVGYELPDQGSNLYLLHWKLKS